MKILVLGNAAQRFLGIKTLIAEIVARDPTFHFAIVVPRVHWNAALIFENAPNVKIIPVEDYEARTTVWQKKRHVFKERIAKLFLQVPLCFQFLKSKELDRFRYYQTICDRILDEEKPQVILITGDRHLGLEPGLLISARRRGVPTVIPYLVYPSKSESLLKSRRTDRWTKVNFRTQRYFKTLMQRHPKSFIDDVSFYPPWTMSALSELQVLSNNPWHQGCGLSDVFCLNSPFDANERINDGVPSHKIKVVGDIAFDPIYKSYAARDRLRDQYRYENRLKKDRVVIVSLPQLAEHDLLSWEQHWKEIRFLMSILTRIDAEVLISLHPRMDPEKYEFLIHEYPCQILTKPLTEVLVLADLFVATFSSTIPWAILCGIPAVVVDFYDLSYKMYDHLQSIVIVRDREKLLEACLKQITGPVEFNHDWKLLGRDRVFDGATSNRYIELFQEISS